MLHLMTGISRGYKTGLLHRRIGEAVGAGRKATLIVPEQASFANERALSLLLKTDAPAVSVVSFTRLAQLLVRKLGGAGREVMDDAAACFLMSVALEELSDELVVYRRHHRSRGFIEQMVSMAAECKNASVSPEALARFSFEQPSGTLKEKSYELSLILDAFDAVARRGYIGQSELLLVAAERLSESGELAGQEVFVDDFDGFTAPELALLEAAASQAAQMTVTLCCDRLLSDRPAFAQTADTAARLIRMAQRADIPWDEMATPQQDADMPPELAALEYAMRCEAMPDPAQGGPAVQAKAAANPYEELVQAACEIARSVREEGLRYREIAVIARDITRYKTMLPSVFGRYQIPFFLDLRADPQSSALSQGVLAAVRLAGGGRGADPLLLAKSPLLGMDVQTVGELENYCFVWSVRPRQWHRPFLNHPDGLRDAMSREARERLSRIEAARRAVTEPVARLQKALQGRDGEVFARGMAGFLDETGAAGHLSAFADRLAPTDRRQFLDEQALLWDHLMRVLDLFAGLPKSVVLTAARAAELMELALGAAEVATPPLTLDEVMVGTAERMRPERPKVVFLLGAAEGEFPALPAPGGLLSDAERRRMVQSGLTLLSESDRLLDAERMYCYRAATAASQRVVVSCPAADARGERLAFSQLFARAAALAQPDPAHPLPEVQTAASAEIAWAARLTHNTAEALVLREVCRRALPGERFARLDGAARRRIHRIEDKTIAQRLFGTRMKISPSRLEGYYQCPFSYFMRSGLRAQPRRKAELSPLEAGTLIHRVLERMVSAHGGKGLALLDDEAVRAEIRALTEQYITERIGDVAQAPKRLLHGFFRMGDWLFELVRRLGEEFSQSRFEPAAFELSIKEAGGVPPLVLTTSDGAEILVEGTIDRVDVATVRGQRYVRVVDYKSGGRTFRLSDVFYGLNMQMLLYLFTIWENGGGDLSGSLPAGVLYLPAMGRYQSGGRDEEEKFLEKRRRQYRMNGLLLSEPDVLRAMEADGRGIFIPVRAGQSESDALATLAEMGRLRRLVEERVRAMAERLHAGDIAATPAGRGGETPCRVCDYRGVCGFEQEDPVREIKNLSRGEIFAQEVGEDG
jgi:ATP-dependent helicase/nuclease subunit B